MAELRVLVAVLVASWIAPSLSVAQTARESSVQVSYDGTTNVVQKDFGSERWSVTFRKTDGAVIGNVFFTDGSAPAFLSCAPVEATEEDLTYQCDSAGACVDGPCSVRDYRETSEPAVVPRSFFLMPGEDTALEFVRDLTGFESFRFARQRGAGFCPPADSIFAAEIDADGEGAFTITQTILEEGEEGDADCLPDVFSGECLRPVVLEPRVLTGAEVDALLGAFGTVVAANDADPICEILAVDPCLIHAFEWDELRVSDYLCGGPRVGYAQGQEIIAVLDGFAR